MPGLNASAKCACRSGGVRLGMRSTQCKFPVCLACHLVPTNNHESRVKAPEPFIDHAIEHVKYNFAADEIQKLAYNVLHRIWPWQSGSSTQP
jgi:hypothetical protein